MEHNEMMKSLLLLFLEFKDETEIERKFRMSMYMTPKEKKNLASKTAGAKVKLSVHSPETVPIEENDGGTANPANTSFHSPGPVLLANPGQNLKI